MQTKKLRLDEKFSDRLAQLIKHSGKKKAEFSRIINVSQGNLSDWLNKRSQPDGLILIRLYEEFGVNIKWLMTGKGQMFVSSLEQNTTQSLGQARAEDFESKIYRLRDLLGRCFVRDESGKVIRVSPADKRELVDLIAELVPLFSSEELIIIKWAIEKEQIKRQSEPKPRE